MFEIIYPIRIKKEATEITRHGIYVAIIIEGTPIQIPVTYGELSLNASQSIIEIIKWKVRGTHGVKISTDDTFTTEEINNFIAEVKKAEQQWISQ